MPALLAYTDLINGKHQILDCKCNLLADKKWVRKTVNEVLVRNMLFF